MLFLLSVAIAVVAFFAWRSAARKVRAERNAAYQTTALVAGSIAALFVIIAISQCITVIPAGNVGVVDFFGTVSDNTLKAGINFVNPLARVVKFSVQTQEVKEVMDVPSKEGLTVQLEVSALYHLNPEKAAQVYKTVGENYAEIILEPQFRSVARGVTAGYEAKALYTSEREMLSQIILVDLQKLVEPRGITVEAAPLRRVGLPAGLTQSIEDKLRAEQESQRMQFVLTKEKLEAERKRIEAQGIADFQTIVTKGISEPLLRWKGIEATEKISNSPNAKVIIIGAGKDGLPLILDTK
ncbi:MAG: membrane protease subunit, stomatin/prohibitin [Ignavibacteriales bacterium CG07_land_8_20_14_0_80_59_12]|nr:MAG: membrane protease subunit, stomatin/prohibitin [Ignavibacteriales bacterium CG07_land_8_20_14_0_80_59_12]